MNLEMKREPNQLCGSHKVRSQPLLTLKSKIIHLDPPFENREWQGGSKHRSIEKNLIYRQNGIRTERLINQHDMK